MNSSGIKSSAARRRTAPRRDEDARSRLSMVITFLSCSACIFDDSRSYFCFIMTTLAVSVLPAKMVGAPPQLTLEQGTLTVTVIAVSAGGFEPRLGEIVREKPVMFEAAR